MSQSGVSKMTEKRVEGKVRRQRYSAEFKRQALLRAVKDGVPAAARETQVRSHIHSRSRASKRRANFDTFAYV